MAQNDDDKSHVRISGDLMGVPVEARSDGRIGIDEEVMRDRVEHGINLRVQSWIESCGTQILLAIFFAGLFLGISCLCGYATWRQISGDPLLGDIPTPASSATEDAAPVAKRWDGTAPLECGGHDAWTVEGTTASLAGQAAVVASGHCELTLVDVTLDARVGIRAGGHATVTVAGGSITGSEAAVSAGGHAEVTLRGVETSGALDTAASGRIVEE